MNITGGMITALITPFNSDDSIDFKSLENLVKAQLKAGVDGFVISGTTAESPNLSNEEVRAVFQAVKKQSPKGFQLILGVGTNSTKGTIDKINFFEDLEPTGYLVVVPYYNKPSQAGMIAHFKAVAASTKRDIVLYDIPGRSVVEMDQETIVELSNVNNIVAVKDATGNISKIIDLKNNEQLSKDFIFLSGDDGTTCDFMKEGGLGVISVLSHVIPTEFKRCMQGEGDFAKYSKLCDLLFMEPNPTPVKSALKKMGILKTDEMRLPLLQMTTKNSELLSNELKNLGVL